MKQKTKPKKQATTFKCKVICGCGIATERYINLVEQIPQHQRITTVTIKRDEQIIEKIQERVSAAKTYYDELIKQMVS